MISKTEYLTFNTKTTRAFVNITSEVRNIVEQSEIKEGLCLVNAMHITASVFINDNETGLHKDFDIWLEKLAPHGPTEQYKHNETGEDNADAHLKRQTSDLKICRIVNGMWQVAGGHWYIDHELAIEDMTRYHETGLTTWEKD